MTLANQSKKAVYLSENILHLVISIFVLSNNNAHHFQEGYFDQQRGENYGGWPAVEGFEPATCRLNPHEVDRLTTRMRQVCV